MKPLLIFRILFLCAGVAALANESPANSSNAAGAAVFNSSVTNGLSLGDAIRLALANNPDLRGGGEKVQAARGRAEQAGVWANPELELASEDVPLTSGKFRDSKNTVGVSQAVPWPGKKRLDRSIGEADVRRNEAELTLRRLHLTRDVKVAFYRVIASERIVKMAQELANVAESSAATARKRVQAGAAADQELLRAEIQLDQAVAEVGGFKRDLAAARQQFATLLARPELAEVPLSGTLVETTAPLNPPDLRSLIETHPGLEELKAERARAELEYRRARLEPYPDVKVGVDGGREGREDNAIIQFRVSVPLPILDRSKGRKFEAQANVNVVEAELASAELRLRRDVLSVCEYFNTTLSQVAAYRDRIIPKADRALHLVKTGFDEGKFTLIDLLDTQRTTAEAHLAYQQKLLDLNIALAEWEVVLGKELNVN